jgi:hypothetical protein
MGKTLKTPAKADPSTTKMGRGTGTAIEGSANREGMGQGRGMDRERGAGGEARGEPTSIATETVDDPHRETGTRTAHHAVIDGGRQAPAP